MTSGGAASRWEGRRRAREAALRMLYQVEVGRHAIGDVVHADLPDAGAAPFALDDDARAYAGALARGAWEAREALDGRIAEAATNWRVERLAIIDRQLLRLAVHELIAHPGTPPPVVIDEAIELARAYSGDEAARFVNGVLDGVLRKLREEGKVIE